MQCLRASRRHMLLDFWQTPPFTQSTACEIAIIIDYTQTKTVQSALETVRIHQSKQLRCDNQTQTLLGQPRRFRCSPLQYKIWVIITLPCFRVEVVASSCRICARYYVCVQCTLMCISCPLEPYHWLHRTLSGKLQAYTKLRLSCLCFRCSRKYNSPIIKCYRILFTEINNYPQRCLVVMLTCVDIKEIVTSNIWVQGPNVGGLGYRSNKKT